MKKFLFLILLLPLQMMAQNTRIYYHEEYHPLKDNPGIVQFYQGLIKDPQPVESSYAFSEKFDFVCYYIYLDEDRAEVWTASEHFHGLSPENNSFMVAETVSYEGKDYPVTKIINLSWSRIGELMIGSNIKEIENNAFNHMYDLRKVTLPEGLTAIPRGLFEDCSGLESVSLPASVTSIGDYAFSGARRLTEITLPASLTSIGNRAFSGTRQLTEITLPEGLKTIGSYAFDGCEAMTSFSIPSSVTYIGANAFLGCELDDVYCYSMDVPEMGHDFMNHDAFSRMLTEQKQKCTLHVPAAAIDKYKSAEGWKNFTSIVSIGTDITDGIHSSAAADHKAALIFDLQGRKLQQKTRKGIYIENGKKVIR